MSERPIIFSTPMVRVILQGRKTQTRRVMRPQPPPIAGLYFRHCGHGLWAGYMPPGEPADIPEVRAPYEVGDTLWVRESFANIAIRGYDPTYLYRADGDELPPFDLRATDNRWRPSIHMPRTIARLFLRVTGVRVERVQDISEEDAAAEGVTERAYPGTPNAHDPADKIVWVADDRALLSGGFGALWDHLNYKRGFGWDADPWVWAIEFERLPDDDREPCVHCQISPCICINTDESEGRSD